MVLAVQAPHAESIARALRDSGEDVVGLGTVTDKPHAVEYTGLERWA